MKTLVIDANIALKWIFAEPFRAEALQFLQPGYRRVAPDFLFLEVLSAIHKKIGSKILTENEGFESFQLVKRKGLIEIIPTRDIYRRAFTLANSIPHAIYDCLYLAAAEREGAVVVTADRKFYDRTQNSAYRHLISWIEDPLSTIDN